MLGAVAAFVSLVRLGRHFTPEVGSHELSRLFGVCYILGYLGARALSILVEEPGVSLIEGLLRFGPMTFYGGAIAAFVGGALFVRARRLPFAGIVDIAIPAGLLALAIGRVGCFLNGDDYGKAVPLAGGEAPWWSVTFPVLEDGVARYPVQLMEAAVVVLLASSLVWGFRRLTQAFRPGIVGFLGVVGYANLRFGLEFWRDDFRGSPLGNWMSTSQFISTLILVACALTVPYWVMRRRSGEAGKIF